MNQNIDSKNPMTQIIVAIIALIGTIIFAFTTLQAAKAPVTLVIQATQTAEARKITQFPPTSPPSTQNSSIDTVIVTVVVTATPESAAPTQQIESETSTSDVWINIRFTPNAYFFFSFIVGVLVLNILMTPLLKDIFSIAWFLYFSTIAYYNYYLINNAQNFVYTLILSLLITLGLGLVKRIRPYHNFSYSLLDSILAFIFLMPPALAIVIAGWNQVDLLTYVPRVFPWSMTFYCAWLLHSLTSRRNW